ncbi:unnamed protein product [Kluyveromyces dobzhanskii CBS 2104]|uniref:WGS project CCBQ000000000 data, contig 00272 n=1 Tax=Kluyveromyces dobzhanskii CBS 2104 TaxID=1427455 RepID=A0A0A8LAT8_9SACH|nr:unnamed protein product [Kluyveromyces dobzhanskii CBS 2104]
MLPESRLRSLYSDFRELRLLNIDGYEANIRQWKEWLIKEFWSDLTIVSTTDLLLELSNAQYGAPKSIDVVLDDMVKEGTLIPMSAYRKRNQSIVLSIMKWTINKTVMDLSWKSRANETARYLKPTKYVNMAWLKKNDEVIHDLLKTNIYESGNPSTINVFTKSHFYKASGINTVTKDWESYEIVLDSLCDSNQIVVSSEDIVKVISPLSYAGTNSQSREISEEDVCVANINEYIFTAESEIKSAESVVELTTKRLSNAISSGLSQEIKRTLLRLKKRSERNLEQGYTSLESLKKLQDEISKASQNVVMVNIMSQASTALKAINSQLLSEDSISNIIDEFQENTEKQDRIHDLLVGETVSDDDALEGELAQLEKELSKEDTKKDPKETVDQKLSKSSKETESTEDLAKKLASLRVSEHVPSDSSENNVETAKKEEVPHKQLA